MSTKFPLLTVLMPARDAEEYIGSAIQSTLNQTFSDFELWVLENGSSDRTVEIASSFNDSRVRVFQLGPIGFQGSLQFGIENANSKWVARMDADDLMFPDRLQTQLAVLKKNQEFVLVGTAYALLTPFGHVFEKRPSVESRQVNKTLLGAGKHFADPSVLFNRHLALEVGGYDPEFTMGDVPLWFRLLSRGFGWRIGQPLHLYRLREGSMSREMTKHEQVLKAREKYAPATLENWAKSPVRRSFWEHIGMLELMAGDLRSVRQSISLMGTEDGFQQEAKKLAFTALAGKFATKYYSYRNRHSYRHRSDWESLFRPLLASERISLNA